MRSFLHGILTTPTHCILDVKAGQLLQHPYLTHTSPEDASEIIGPSQNSALWSCSHLLLPSPSRMRAWYQTRREGNSLSCWIIFSSFSKHFSSLHFLGCAWHTLNSLRPQAVDLCLLAVAMSTLARNPSLPHKRFFNYDLQLLILNS